MYSHIMLSRRRAPAPAEPAGFPADVGRRGPDERPAPAAGRDTLA